MAFFAVSAFWTLVGMKVGCSYGFKAGHESVEVELAQGECHTQLKSCHWAINEINKELNKCLNKRDDYEKRLKE